MRPAASMGGRHQQPLLETEFTSQGGMRRIRVAEVAGGATAECAAVCCCAPCVVAELVVLAVYKVPAGLCRKALRKQRHRRLMKKGMMQQRNCGSCCDDEFFQLHSVCSSGNSTLSGFESLSDDAEVVELEKEMIEKFYGAGFWRSPSQKSDTSDLSAVTI